MRKEIGEVKKLINSRSMFIGPNQCV